MTIKRNEVLIGIAVSAGLLLSVGAAAAENSPPISAARIAEIVASPDRGAADRTNDLRREPEQMPGYTGIRTGIVAVDISAAGGYTTELPARAIGPTGTVYGQSRSRDPNRPPTPPAAPEGNSHPSVAPAVTQAAPASGPRPSPVALAEREAKLRAAGIPAAPIVAVSQPFEDPIPCDLSPDRVDLVTLMFNYHDLRHMGVDRAAMNLAVFRGLKSVKP